MQKPSSVMIDEAVARGAHVNTAINQSHSLLLGGLSSFAVDLDQNSTESRPTKDRAAVTSEDLAGADRAGQEGL